MSRQGNISIKEKNVYRNLYSKAEVRFARQFGYEKAIRLQGIWLRVDTPKAKKFEENAKKAGYTGYVINAFISAKRGNK